MINWFPGHMAKANRDVEKMQKLADVFVIVLDGRAPISSYNKEFEKFAPKTSRIFVVSKFDMADQTKKEEIIKNFTNLNSKILFGTLTSRSFVKSIMKKIIEETKIIAEKNTKHGLQRKVFRIIVLGVPNSGKSTLINSMAGRKVVKVANKPGVTRNINWVNLGNFQVLDTPGLLWPKLNDQLVGVKLAMIGAISIDALPITDFSYECLKLITKYYPNKLKTIEIEPVKNDLEARNAIYKFAIEKKWLLKNNQPNLQKAMRYIIKYTQDLKGVTYD